MSLGAPILVAISSFSRSVAGATLADSLLLSKVQDYRRAAAMRLYPLDGGDVPEKIPAAEFHVSRKIDGEFTVLVFRQGEVFTLNPGGTVRVGLPFLDEAARLLAKAGVKEAMIAGELYQALRVRFPRFSVRFEPAPVRQALVDTWPGDVEDARARADWGFSPRHGLAEALDQYLLPALQGADR